MKKPQERKVLPVEELEARRQFILDRIGEIVLPDALDAHVKEARDAAE